MDCFMIMSYKYNQDGLKNSMKYFPLLTPNLYFWDMYN